MSDPADTHVLTPPRRRILQACADGHRPYIPHSQLAWFRREGYVQWTDPPRPPRQSGPGAPIFSRTSRKFCLTAKALSALGYPIATPSLPDADTEPALP